MQNKFFIVIICIVFINAKYSYSNNLIDSKDSLKIDSKHKVFGCLYTGFYYSLNNNIVPRSRFELSAGLLGYTYAYSDKIKAIMCYDVTRTTSDISVNEDSTSNKHSVNFFEGSKYTAYLKQAEINWQFHKNFELSIGEILNEQYLTVQDKFWNYRYISTTYQELYRYGNPADFGARLVFKIKDIFKYNISVVNGEGPFKYQDNNSKFLVANNIEFCPSKFIFKLYADFQPPSIESSIYDPKTAISLFVAYKTDKFRIGGEYNRVDNYNFESSNDYYGSSVYSAYSLNEKFDILARYDYIKGRYDVTNKCSIFKENHYLIAGAQYQPVKNVFASLNIRGLFPDERYQVYINFGIKF